MTVMNSEEEDEQQLEAASSESPESKDSWTSVPATDEVETSLDKTSNSHASYVMNEAADMKAKDSGQVKITKFENNIEEKIPADTHKSERDELELLDGGWEMKVPRRDSQCSTDTVTLDERSDGHASTPCADCKPRLLPTVLQETFVEDGDDDDDFGDFEEVEAMVPLADEDDDDDEFGEFSEMPSAVASLPAVSVARSGSLLESTSSFLKLKGLDYASATTSLFGRISPQRPLLSSRMGPLMTLREMRIHACMESRLGAPLLYPRQLPAGFLRTSGPPVQLSTKITMTEQRLLGRLGLHESYVRAHRQQSMAEVINDEVSSSASPTSEMRGGLSVSELPCTVDDLGLDLDFLVHFTSQQPSGSVAESSKNERDSVSGEDVHRPTTYLHELFDGIIESSQSSFISHSSEPSETKQELLPLSVATEDNPVQEPCLSENDWDAFVNAAPAKSRNASQDFQIQDTAEEEWNGFAEAAVEDQTEEKGTKDDDIFSSDWLHQLQSSHASPAPEENRANCVKQVTEATEVSESEWGMFTEAPSDRTSTDVDPFQSLVPVAHEREHLPPNHGLPMGYRPPLPLPVSNAFAELDLSVLESFKLTEPQDTQKPDFKNKPLAMGQSLFAEPAQSQSGYGVEEDEWGGFQG